jgi:hypothetical protein
MGPESSFQQSLAVIVTSSGFRLPVGLFRP